jgi:hypothetical protein
VHLLLHYLQLALLLVVVGGLVVVVVAKAAGTPPLHCYFRMDHFK